MRPLGKPQLTFIGYPSGGQFVDTLIPSLKEPISTPYTYDVARGPGSFNRLWVTALNKRDTLGLTHFGMQHTDVSPKPFPFDILHAEMMRVDADIISCVIPLKDERGLTSTVVQQPGGAMPTRRLTVREANALPPTFSLLDIPWADKEKDTLLLNNGLWLCRFVEPWVEEVTFRFYETNLKTEAGLWWNHMASEDLAFSFWAAKEKGLRLFATTAVDLIHTGAYEFPSRGDWGTWEKDTGNTGEWA